MKQTQNKIFIIVGPTATGKTALGLKLAKKYNGEIISADSRQVYQGIDIIAGKDINKNSKLIIKNSELGIKKKTFSVGFRRKEKIPIWLVDIVSPNYVFNVGEYAKLAKKVIKYLHNRNKLPIIVGGTGLYVKSLTHALEYVQIAPDYQLRQQLADMPVTKLQNVLKEINIDKWKTMNRSDRYNPRRLIRAIEITKKQRKAKTTKKQQTRTHLPFMDSLIVGLTTDKKNLYKKIDKRVDERIKQGALDEVEKLLSFGYGYDKPSFSSIGLNQLKKYFQTETSDADEKNKLLNKCIDNWKQKELSYAKRQITWFKKNDNIVWFDISDEKYYQEIEKTLARWYT